MWSVWNSWICFLESTQRGTSRVHGKMELKDDLSAKKVRPLPDFIIHLFTNIWKAVCELFPFSLGRSDWSTSCSPFWLVRRHFCWHCEDGYYWHLMSWVQGCCWAAWNGHNSSVCQKAVGPRMWTAEPEKLYPRDTPGTLSWSSTWIRWNSMTSNCGGMPSLPHLSSRVLFWVFSMETEIVTVKIFFLRYLVSWHYLPNMIP